jgi:integrase
LLAGISEFDLDNRIWIFLPARMKAAKERRIPQSDASLETLANARKQKVSGLEYAFESSA